MRLSPVRPLVVALGLLITTNGPVFYVANRVLDNGLSWEESFTRGVFAALAVTAVAAVALDRYRIDGARLAAQNQLATVAIVVFTGWLVASSLWSLDPDLTRGRALIYVGLAALAWIIADLGFRDFRLALTTAAFGAVLMSLVAIVVSDSIGADFNGDWRGVFTNRNSLAPVAGVAILMGLSLMLSSRGRARWLAATIPVLSGVAMIGSGSRTAILAVVVAAGLAALVVLAKAGGDRYGPRVRWTCIGLGGLGIIATAVVVSQLWGEPTFAQRRTIWRLVWDRIGERPLHGFGWFNVWANPEFTAADPLLGRGSAHASFFEVWLGLGLIGLIPFLVIVALAVHGSATAAWRRPSVATWTWLALVLFLVIENLTESFVLWFSYNWVLLMVAALKSDFARRPRVALRKREASAMASG